VCSEDEIQTRECKDLRKCGSIKNKPKEIRKCIYVEKPSCFDGVQNQDEVLVDCGGVCKPCPTCRDGIQNQGEKGVDCGGPCKACKELREPAKVQKFSFSLKDLTTDVKLYWFVWLLLSLLLLSTLRVTIYLKDKGLSHSFSFLLLPVRILRLKLLMKKTKNLLEKNNVVEAKKTYEKAKKLYQKLPKKLVKNIKL
jgi:hypothetical protein